MRINESTGDVFAEVRGKKEDASLKKFFTIFQQHSLTHPKLIEEDLVLKKKTDLVCGLELADLLALPCKVDILCAWDRIEKREHFTQKVIDKIQIHYHRDPLLGRVNNFGKQLIF